MVAEFAMEVELRLAHGTRLQREGDVTGAVACFQQALRLNARSSAAYNNLANVFASLKDQGTAFTFFRAALALEPCNAIFHNNLANLYLEQDQVASAIESYSHAIALQPGLAMFHNNLGNAFRMNEQITEAEQEFYTALRLNSLYADAYVNLGFLFLEQERFVDAEVNYRSAIAIDSQNALAHNFLSHLLLRNGNFAEGWREHEWRWRCPNFSSPRRWFDARQWQGEELRDQTLFVHAEQGFGDTLQFLRYIPLLAARGIRVVLEVHPELRSIASTLAGVSVLVSRGDTLPFFAWHCPLMSLPLVLGTQVGDIPNQMIPYLKAGLAGDLSSAPQGTDVIRVGVVWRGNPKTPFAKRRSMPLGALQPLAHIENVRFYSLQFTPSEKELRECPLHFDGLLPEQSDFASTAAIVSRLDLVISVDTSVAHLAGALGIPVWILLPRLADWRWLRERDDSPWYPHAKLYRQTAATDWLSVIKSVSHDLERLVTARHSEGERFCN